MAGLGRGNPDVAVAAGQVGPAVGPVGTWAAARPFVGSSSSWTVVVVVAVVVAGAQYREVVRLHPAPL